VSEKASENRDSNSIIVELGKERSTEIAAVGGKGASLGRLVKAGFPVPSGFVVATDAYAAFIKANDLDAKISNILEGIDYSKPEKVEEETARIRDAIVGSPVPDDLADQIVSAYEKLGDAPYVAVRSSGTAEDLAGASFAGQYDTYLDIRGADVLLDAVRRCWGSMWTARVTAYREDKGFGQSDIGIAVVVQTMVAPDVAGVMFVGNPLNAMVSEIVINASWGLGEAVVSGIVTPDEFVVSRNTLAVRRKRLGGKELRIFRNEETGSGTVEEPVPEDLQKQYTISDDQAGELAELGNRVNTYHDGLPQDTEWAMKDGKFYLLQSRPITGVLFTWEEDLDLWPDQPEDGEDVIWSRGWADEIWTGAITPLMWSIRGMMGPGVLSPDYAMLGIDGIGEMRLWKYHQGVMYSNTKFDIQIAELCLPPELRRPLLNYLHPSQMEDAMSRPFDLWRCLKVFAGIEINNPNVSGHRVMKTFFDFAHAAATDREVYEMHVEMANAVIPSQETLRAMSIEEIKEKIQTEAIDVVEAWSGTGGWNNFYVYGPMYMSFLEGIIEHWYDGDKPLTIEDFVVGLPDRTQEFSDHYDVWKLADTIRRSEKLSALIEAFEGPAFFEELENHEEGRVWLEQYQNLIRTQGWRGHADRDFYHNRRMEDPWVDYNALRLLATSGDLDDPAGHHEKLRLEREAVNAALIDNLSQQPFGEIKVTIVNFLMDFIRTLIVARDFSRPLQGDAGTFKEKLLLAELGRRALEKGLLEDEEDFYFLTYPELTGLIEGTEPKPLAKAKIAGRRPGFFGFLTHEDDPPMFLKGNDPLELHPPTDEEGVLKGVGTSAGTTTGRARIVPKLEDIGRLEKGDILVCHGTDPGWSSAFNIVNGVIAQTGGLTAHFSCLSREYGMPAIYLPDALKYIEDGTMIEMNGRTGEIRLAAE